MTAKLIVALDFDDQHAAFSLVDALDPKHCALKVGSELFTRFGTQFVKQLINKQFAVFLDLKFHDIPNTVAKSCKAGADLGVWMMNVHASGGTDMMQAAKTALEPYGKTKPLLIAVTVLTSFNAANLTQIGVQTPLMQQVTNLATLAYTAGLDGVVCSAHEVQAIKALCDSSFLAVTPGIRLPDNSLDDQSRVMTPQQAIQAGSDYLVVGRPITQAKDPSVVVSEILASIKL